MSTKKKGRRKDQVSEYAFQVRMTLDEKKHLERQCETVGINSKSAFVRALIAGKSFTPKVDLMLINELRRLGGLVKKTHNQTGGAYSEETAQILRDLSDAIKSITRAVSKS